MPTGIYDRKLSKQRPRQSIEAKRKIGLANSKALKGYKQSKEHKEKVSKALRLKYSIGKDSEYCDSIDYKSWRKNRSRLKRKWGIQGPGHTFGEWELLKKQYNFTCPCCKKSEPEIKLTEDHIIPLSKGGSDLIENIQPLCSHCNAIKYTKIIKY